MAMIFLGPPGCLRFGAADMWDYCIGERAGEGTVTLKQQFLQLGGQF